MFFLHRDLLCCPVVVKSSSRCARVAQPSARYSTVVEKIIAIYQEMIEIEGWKDQAEVMLRTATFGVFRSELDYAVCHKQQNGNDSPAIQTNSSVMNYLPIC
jgi:hypothetical protein